MTRRRSRRPMHERGEDIAAALAKSKRALLGQVPRSEPKKPVHDWWSANQAWLVQSTHQQIAPTAPLVSTFQAVAAPRPSQRKVRPKQSMLRQWVDGAQHTIRSARAMFDEYETFIARQGWALGGLRSEGMGRRARSVPAATKSGVSAGCRKRWPSLSCGESDLTNSEEGPV